MSTTTAPDLARLEEVPGTGLRSQDRSRWVTLWAQGLHQELRELWRKTAAPEVVVGSAHDSAARIAAFDRRQPTLASALKLVADAHGGADLEAAVEDLRKAVLREEPPAGEPPPVEELGADAAASLLGSAAHLEELAVAWRDGDGLPPALQRELAELSRQLDPLVPGAGTRLRMGVLAECSPEGGNAIRRHGGLGPAVFDVRRAIQWRLDPDGRTMGCAFPGRAMLAIEIMKERLWGLARELAHAPERAMPTSAAPRPCFDIDGAGQLLFEGRALRFRMGDQWRALALRKSEDAGWRASKETRTLLWILFPNLRRPGSSPGGPALSRVKQALFKTDIDVGASWELSSPCKVADGLHSAVQKAFGETRIPL